MEKKNSLVQFLLEEKNLLQQKSPYIHLDTLLGFINEFISKVETPSPSLALNSSYTDLDSSQQAKKREEEEQQETFVNEVAKLTFEKKNRYTQLENLGEGGMGVVELVQDSILGREVALKRIKATKFNFQNSKKKMLLWRLKREASLTATLEHPNIVPLYDLQEESDGEFYFTMRKVQGKTLKDILRAYKEKKGETTEPSSVLSIFLKVCDAIAYAHSKGVIHRDLKPENIMVGEFGEVYVMDWGIGKRLQDDFEVPIEIEKKSECNEKEQETFLGDFSNTKEQILEYRTRGGIGTMGYMAPEQQEDAESVSIAADIYSLGIMLRECFTYSSPVESFLAKLEQFENGSSISKVSLKKQENVVPVEMQAIIKKATKKEVLKRYENVQAFAHDIENYLANKRVSVRDYSPFEVLQKWVKRNKQKVIFGTIVFGLCVVFLLSFFWEKRREKEERFQKAWQKALFEKKQAKQALLEGKKGVNQRISFLLNALNSLNTALVIKKESKLVEEEKFITGKELVVLSCQTADYRLAFYVSQNMEDLSSVPLREIESLKQKVKQEEGKKLKQHEERLSYWIEALKSRVPGMKEQALLEINKMQEPEIYERLKKLVKKRTESFLTNKNQTASQIEYSILIAEMIGWLEKPESDGFLIQQLKQMMGKVSQDRSEKVSDLQYMVALANSLGTSGTRNALNFLIFLRNKRARRGELFFNTDLFYYNTQITFKKLIQIHRLADGKAKTASEFIKQSVDFKDLGKLEQAILSIQKGIALAPGNASYYVQLGSLYSLKGEGLKAKESFRKALALNPDLIEAYQGMVVALSRLKQFEEALHYSNLATQKTTNVPLKLLRNRAILKFELGDSKGALEDCNRVLEQAQNYPGIYNTRGLIKGALGDKKGAIKDFDKAIELLGYPEQLRSYLNRGNIKKELGLWEEAIADYSFIIQQDAKDYKAYFNRGGAKEQKKDIKGALVDYKEAIRFATNKTDQAQIYNKMGILKQGQNLYEEALLDYQRAIELAPKIITSYWGRFAIKFQQNQFEEAILELDKLLHQAPNDFEALLNRGFLKAFIFKYDSALQDLLAALKLNSNYKVHFYLGQVYSQKENLEQAILHFEKSLTLKKDEKKTIEFLCGLYFSKAIQLFRQKKYQEAKEALFRFQKHAPAEHPLNEKVKKALLQVESKIKAPSKK